MSAERFLKSYSEDHQVGKTIELWRSQEGKSAPRVFGERILAESGSTLREIQVRRWRHGSPIGADPNASQNFNVATALFGIALISIEETISKQVFEPRMVAELFSTATSGVYTLADTEPEFMTYGDWRQMVYEAQADKTLLRFFGPDGRMPKKLKWILEHDTSRPLATINARIIPAYKQIISSVIPEPPDDGVWL